MILDVAEIAAQVEHLVERERYEQATALLAQGLEMEPGHAHLRYLHALITLRQENPGEALDLIDELLESDPAAAHVRELRCEALVDLESYPEAELEIISLLRDFPEHAPFYARYAMLMLQTMHLDKAGALAAEAIRLDPDDRTALLVASLVEVIEDPSDANRHNLRELMRRYPEAESTLRLTAAALTAQRRLSDAEPLVQQLVRMNPASAPTVEWARQVAVARHWSLLPLRPLQRHGWLGSAVLWFVVVVLLTLMAGSAWAHLVTPLVVLWLAFVVYSWIWPYVLKRWIIR